MSLPSGCAQSMSHAALVCTGTRPIYFITPGFAPLELSWGWLFVGILIGSLLRPHWAKMMRLLLELHHRQPRRQRPRERLLEDIRNEGLYEIAADANMDPHDLLMQVLRGN